MLATIRTAVRRSSTNRRIASASYVKAHITLSGTDLYLTTKTYGHVAWSTGRGRQSGTALTGNGPVSATQLVPHVGGMSASPECEAAVLEAANAVLAAVGWRPETEWNHYWSDSELDTWEVRIVRV